MDCQEIFSTVVMHLLHQNAKSMDGDGRCMYRGDQGRKCAVGALIPDASYSSDMEGKRADDVILSCSGLADQITGDGLKLLVSLQSVHDDWGPCSWREQLAHVANRYGLRMPGGLA